MLSLEESLAQAVKLQFRHLFHAMPIVHVLNWHMPQLLLILHLECQIFSSTKNYKMDLRPGYELLGCNVQITPSQENGKLYVPLLSQSLASRIER